MDQTIRYKKKIIISGLYIEYYQYEKVLKKNYKREKREKSKEGQLDLLCDIIENKESKQLIKRKDSINRTRAKIKRTINANPDLTKFVTLTFEENAIDVCIANKEFNKFVMRLEYRYPDFKYICIIEFQKRGAVHYHFLCNLPYIENTKLRKIWKNGFVRINKIKHVVNVGSYVCKYLQKDMTDIRLFNKKKYFCSKNLDQPIEIYDDEIIEKFIAQYDLNTIQPDYELTARYDFIGEVTYKAWRLMDSPA